MDSIDRRLLLGAAGLVGVAAASRLAHAGPLTPPPGPVAPTPGPEPRTPISAATTPGVAGASIFRITQPGSYYLQANLDVPAARTGIQVDAERVTIDLAGFTIAAVDAGPSTGVGVASSQLFVVVRRGSFFRLNLALALGDQSTVEDVVVSKGNGIGIRVGRQSVVRRCAVGDTTAFGIETGDQALVESCSARNCTDGGFNLGPSSLAADCIASDNGGAGFLAKLFTQLHRCTAQRNDGSGIVAQADAAVLHCSACDNGQHGVLAEGGNHLLSNTCARNGRLGAGAGIRVTGGGCRIDSNTCAVNDRGIDVSGSRNLLIRNACTGNTAPGLPLSPEPDFFFTPGVNNAIGQIIGIAGGGSIGAVSPWANFQH